MGTAQIAQKITFEGRLSSCGVGIGPDENRSKRGLECADEAYFRHII